MLMKFDRALGPFFHTRSMLPLPASSSLAPIIVFWALCNLHL